MPIDVLRAHLQPAINEFLAVANAGRAPDADTDPLAVAAHHALLALSEELTGLFVGPAWAEFAFANIASNIGTGDYHLYGCLDCGRWMLVKKKDRTLCPACRRRRHAKRQAKLRQAEYHLQREAKAATRRPLPRRTKP